MEFTQSLKLNHLFRRLYRKGKSSAGRTVVIYCLKNGMDCNRMGITASTKLGHAVVRNRIRRRIREICRHNEEKFLRGYDFVVVARGRSVDATYWEMEHDFLKQARKLGLLREEAHDETGSAVADPVLSE